KLLLPSLAEAGRGGRIEPEEHVGLEAADGAGEVRVDIAAAHDDGQAAGGDDIGEVVGLFDADMRRIGAEEHGDDEKAGAESELGFKFHDVPYLCGDHPWVMTKAVFWYRALDSGSRCRLLRKTACRSLLLRS